MVGCPHCGRENPAGARFCNNCGATLADPEAAREVRKTVTVLFCDVVGSTELASRSDPEVMRGVMARFYAAIREPVERHGGRVEKVIGDALVAVFGIPVVHEDDALRAVRAALEMRDAVRGLGEIQARIGVNTGDVLARDATAGESLVVGDAVNVAARIEQAAAPGEVLVGEATWALVAHAAHGDLAPPIAAKGKSEPLVAWRLESVDAAARGHRRRLDLPMVGRDAELDMLRWSLERTVRLQRPHLVTVLGQPGIGKSRLASEVRRLGADVTVLHGHCRATTSSSLEPLLELAGGLAPGGRDLSERIVEAMPGDDDAAAVAASLAPGGAHGAPDIAWAASRLVRTLAAAGTVAIVLEDVHWADDLLLDVVEQLLGRSRGRALLIVCTARPEFAETRPQWGSGANASTILLERLDADQTRALIAHASPSLPHDRAEHVIAAAEGNPLFAEHLAALFAEGEANGGLPRSIQVLLTARVEALPEAEREVVAAAAIVGREFPVASVESVLGRPVEAELDRLEGRELIEPTRPGRWQFGHALLQEAAYSLIPKRHRAELHEQVARWADAHGDGDALVGDHLGRAAMLRIELGLAGDEADRIRTEAGRRLLAAGRRADALGDPVRATRLLRQALELLPSDGPDQAAAMVELVAAGWNVVPLDERIDLLERGAETAAANGLRGLELRARVLRLGTLPERGPDAHTEQEVLAQTKAALRELEEVDDPRAFATSLCTLGDVETSLGRAASGTAAAQQAIRVTQAAGEDVVWGVKLLMYAVIESPTSVAEAEQLVAELLGELGTRPAVRSQLAQGQALLAILRGGDDGWRLLEAAREIERDLGRSTSWSLRTTRARMHLLAGEYGALIQEMPPLIAELDGADAHANAAVMRSWLAVAQARTGDLSGARDTAAAALAGTTYGGGYETGARGNLALAEVHLAEGAADAAASAARDAVAVAETGDWVLVRAEARLVLARALQASGDTTAATGHAQAALELSRAKGHAGGIAAAEACLRSLAAAPG
jgi:class 3 adenylate cyclase/tetratricopeptide (TPR) repeat protein